MVCVCGGGGGGGTCLAGSDEQRLPGLEPETYTHAHTGVCVGGGGGGGVLSLSSNLVLPVSKGTG